MPLIQVTLVQGRTIEQKHALIAALTDAMGDTLGTPKDRIRVALYEVTADEWGIGGVPFSKARAPQTGDPT